MGKPLLPGKEPMEQLKLTFDLLGTPRPDDKSLKDLPLLRKGDVKIEKEPQVQTARHVPKKLPGAALNLLEKLLELNPTKRLTASRAKDPEHSEQLGVLQLGEGMGEFHECQSKRKRQDSKTIAKKAQDSRRSSGERRERSSERSERRRKRSRENDDDDHRSRHRRSGDDEERRRHRDESARKRNERRREDRREDPECRRSSDDHRRKEDSRVERRKSSDSGDRRSRHDEERRRSVGEDSRSRQGDRVKNGCVAGGGCCRDDGRCQ